MTQNNKSILLDLDREIDATPEAPTKEPFALYRRLLVEYVAERLGLCSHGSSRTCRPPTIGVA